MNILLVNRTINNEFSYRYFSKRYFLRDSIKLYSDIQSDGCVGVIPFCTNCDSDVIRRRFRHIYASTFDRYRYYSLNFSVGLLYGNPIPFEEWRPSQSMKHYPYLEHPQPLEDLFNSLGSRSNIKHLELHFWFTETGDTHQIVTVALHTRKLLQAITKVVRYVEKVTINVRPENYYGFAAPELKCTKDCQESTEELKDLLGYCEKAVLKMESPRI